MNLSSDLQIVAARLPLDGIHVLVLDDDEAARDVVRLLLESEGADVSTAGSAREAFARIDEDAPDVMLLDIAMPEIDGFTFVERLRRRPVSQGGSIPAAALTGYISAEDQAHAERVGFQKYLRKPVDPAELVSAVKSLAQQTPV